MAHVLPEHAGDRAGTGARRSAYEDVASKFFEHFVYISDAMNNLGGETSGCGTKRTAFITMCCTCRTASNLPLKVRSMVGLIPLFAVETLEPDVLDRLPGFQTAHAVVHRKSRPI